MENIQLSNILYIKKEVNRGGPLFLGGGGGWVFWSVCVGEIY